jgi:hypothetical protein
MHLGVRSEDCPSAGIAGRASLLTEFLNSLTRISRLSTYDINLNTLPN